MKKNFTIFFHTWELEGKISAMCCVPLDHVLSIILGNDLIVDRDCRSFLPYSANSLMDPPYMAAFHFLGVASSFRSLPHNIFHRFNVL